MKRAFQRTFAALALTVLSTVNVASSALAVQFGQQEVEQERYVAIAVPRAYGYSLVIVEQISNTTPCWSESGSNPIQVDPLLLNFDFTGICGRATDSNGYSVRMGGEDLALSHSLSVRGMGDEILLVATSRENPYEEPIVIGRTNGMSDSFVKIVLEPGWRFTKRTYQDKTLGHTYFTNDYSASAYSQMVNPSKTNNSTDNRSDNSTDNSTDETTANVTDNSTDETTANATDNSTDETTANVTDNSTDETTANATDNSTDETTANVTDNSTDKKTSNRIYNRTGNISDNKTDNSTDNSAEIGTSNRADNSTDNSAEIGTSNRNYNRVSTRNTNQNTNRFFNRYYDRN